MSNINVDVRQGLLGVASFNVNSQFVKAAAEHILNNNQVNESYHHMISEYNKICQEMAENVKIMTDSIDSKNKAIMNAKEVTDHKEATDHKVKQVKSA